MKNMKKLVILLTVFALVCSMAACGNNSNNGGAGNGAVVEHKVAVRTAGGMAMEGIAVSVYTDEALSNLQGYGQTNAEGIASISIPFSYTREVKNSACPYTKPDIKSFILFITNLRFICSLTDIFKSQNLSVICVN